MDLDLHSIKDEGNQITNLTELNLENENKDKGTFEITPKEVESKDGDKFAIKLDQVEDNDKTDIENNIENSAAEPNLLIVAGP